MRGEELIPQLERRLHAHAGQHEHDALEGLLIARIGQPPEISRNILDVCLFKKSDAAGDGKRNVSARELQLQLERVKMRAIQHRHVVQFDALLAQFQRALGHKSRLLIRRATHHQRGHFSSRSHGSQFLGKLLRIRRDRSVGQLEYLWCAPVVGLNLVHLRARITAWELNDVLKIRATPRVDALRIVAHHHHIFETLPQQVNQLGLQLVGVLILVHQNKLKSPLVKLAHVRVFLHQLEPQHQQVVEIHQPIGALAPGVARQHVDDLLGQLLEPRVAILDDLAHINLLVDGQRADVAHHIRLGKARGFHVNLCLGDTGVDETLGILTILNGKRTRKPQCLRVPPKHAMTNGMKRAAPQLTHVSPYELSHAIHHLARGLVGKCQQQNAIRRHALFQQIRHAIGQRACLT